MKIKIDNREEDLIKNINYLISNIPSFKDIQIIVETLPLGDIIICDDISEKLVIERKSVNDLLSSIKDGRYEEQSYRLNGLNHHNHNIYYLIEGDVNKCNRFKDNKMEKLTLYSAMFSLNYFKGFSVMRTLSLEETATFICNTANKLSKTETLGKKPYFDNKTETISLSENINTKDQNGGKVVSIEKDTEESEKDYVSVVKKVKKENITPENIAEIMLCQIPGISSVTALAVMDKFKTLPNLIQEVQQNQDCLKDISYTNTKGQTRKINKTSILNIVKYLLKK